ncbi:uncharacterized protein LOC134744005 [Cydia strobilella]|uniref:uncharacterized protein LOC134744005 n=1 Tax=Cydia strobilella TaxID=1100964 RepID=UPI0030075802
MYIITNAQFPFQCRHKCRNRPALHGAATSHLPRRTAPSLIVRQLPRQRCEIIMVFSKIQMSDSATMKLIKEVKKHGCIWNPEDENYSDRQHLLVAWDEIAKALDMPEDIIRGKWKILRDFFKREVKRKNVTSVEEYKGRWRYFNSLGYLLHLSLPREEEDERTSEKVDVEIEYEPKYAPDSNLEVYLEDPIPEKRFKPNDSEDYDLMFLKSLTPFFKQLEPTRNLVVRSRIQDMLLNEIAAQKMNRNKM